MGSHLKSGAVYSGNSTYLERYIDLTTLSGLYTLNFYWKVSDGAGKTLNVEVFDNLNQQVGSTQQIPEVRTGQHLSQ
jgi:hypothetical protein